MSFSLPAMAQGIRNAFGALVSQDVAQNPHLLTRNVAKGVSFGIIVQQVDPQGNATRSSGVSVALVLKQEQPDGTAPVVLTLQGVTDSNGQLALSDSAGSYFLTAPYLMHLDVTPPGGSAISLDETIWNGQSSPQGTINGGNWGQGFRILVSLGGTSAVSLTLTPTSGTNPLQVEGSVTVNDTTLVAPLIYEFYESSSDPSSGNSLLTKLASGQLSGVGSFQQSFTVYTSGSVYVQLTDSKQVTRKSGPIPVTVT